MNSFNNKKYFEEQRTVFVDNMQNLNVSSTADGNVLYVLVVGEPDDPDAFMLEFIERNLDRADIYHVRYLHINETFMLEEIDQYFEVSKDQLYEHVDDIVGHYKIIYTADVNALNEDIPMGIQYLHPSGKIKNLFEYEVEDA